MDTRKHCKLLVNMIRKEMVKLLFRIFKKKVEIKVLLEDEFIRKLICIIGNSNIYMLYYHDFFYI